MKITTHEGIDWSGKAGWVAQFDGYPASAVFGRTMADAIHKVADRSVFRPESIGLAPREPVAAPVAIGGDG